MARSKVTREDADAALGDVKTIAGIVDATKMMKGINRKAARKAIGRLRRFVESAALTLPAQDNRAPIGIRFHETRGAAGGWLKS